MNEKLKSYPFIISVIWWLLLLFVNPIGDFPLNDDWSYAHNVEAMVRGEIYFSDWPAMTLIAHTLWGALFCKIFGFSFTVLRFSNLIIGWIGLLATFHFFKEANFSKKHSFWATLLVGFNPLYFSLSYTYMTDVPFYTYMVLASLFFIKAIKNGKTSTIIIATIFSIIACLTRQLGILMPLAFLIVFLIKNRTSLKTVFQGITPLFVSYGIMSSFIKWREVNYGLSDTFGNSSDLIKLITWERFIFFLENLAHVFTSLWGFMLIPLSFLLFVFFIKKIDLKITVSSSVITLLLLFLYWGKWKYHLLGNVIHNFGLGPKLVSFGNTSESFYLSGSAWENVLLYTFIAGVILVFLFITILLHFLKDLFQKKYSTINTAKGFSFFAASIYLGFLVFNNYYFDRYHLILIPFFIIILFPNDLFENEKLIFSKWSITIASLFFILQVFYSVGSTKDYLNYSKANWNLLHQQMEKRQLSHNQIGGGFEFNSWYKNGRTRPLGWDTKDWWLSNNENFISSFDSRCGFNTIDSVAYQQVFPPRENKLYFLKKDNSYSLDTIFCSAENISSDSLFFTTNDSTILLRNANTQNSERSRSGNFSIKMDGKNQYSFSLKMNSKGCQMFFLEVYRYPLHSNAGIVLTTNNPKSFYKFENSWVFKDKEKNPEWGYLSTKIVVPESVQDSVLNFYLFQPSNEEVWFDDLKIMRMDFE